MPETQTHRGYEVRLHRHIDGWMAICDLPKLGTQWYFRSAKDAALRAACEAIDDFLLEANDL